MTKPENPATVTECLSLEHGVQPAERDHIEKLWRKLDTRLRSFRAEDVVLALFVKERDTPAQHTTLEATIARRDAVVASSRHVDLDQALIEVRDDLIRRLTDMKNQSEPRQNRHLRTTIEGKEQ